MKTLFTRPLLAASLCLLAVGCATTKEWSAIGGSRSDGTIKLSYEYGPFEVPQVSEEQAVKLASTRCSTWGYTGAEAFGGFTRVCNAPDGMGGCNRWLVTREYQCLGNPANSGPK